MTPGARAARERKQKIFLIVGGLFLAALLAIQLPKLLGGSSSSSAAPTTTETTGLSGAPAAAPTTTATATPTVLLSGPSPSPHTTILTSFSRFAAKDPFVQQVKAESAPETAATADAGKPAAADEAKKPTAEKQTVATPSKTFTTVKPAKAPAVTIVTVNGTRQILATGMKFPAADPLFVLVAEKQRAKSVVIGVAGGAYAGGSRTTILRVDKSVTLVNTATGARYEISLVSVGSGDAVARPAPDAKKP